MDLGCGHGLLGILALLKGAKCVLFQDFNLEVLTEVTIPNIL
jgi:ribosomal protein L11 methylase PrmA